MKGGQHWEGGGGGGGGGAGRRWFEVKCNIKFDLRVVWNRPATSSAYYFLSHFPT